MRLLLVLLFVPLLVFVLLLVMLLVPLLVLLTQLRRYEGTQYETTEQLADLRTLLAIPDEAPSLLGAEKRLALSAGVHSRLGAASPLSALVEQQLLQTIACESRMQLCERCGATDTNAGCWYCSELRGGRESCAQVLFLPLFLLCLRPYPVPHERIYARLRIYTLF